MRCLNIAKILININKNFDCFVFYYVFIFCNCSLLEKLKLMNIGNSNHLNVLVYTAQLSGHRLGFQQNVKRIIFPKLNS